jgi:hypothetical protein
VYHEFGGYRFDGHELDGVYLTVSLQRQITFDGLDFDGMSMTEFGSLNIGPVKLTPSNNIIRQTHDRQNSPSKRTAENTPSK